MGFRFYCDIVIVVLYAAIVQHEKSILGTTTKKAQALNKGQLYHEV